MIGERLRRARRLGGVSAREVARLAGLPSESHVRTLETALSPNPNANTITAICGVLGISADHLLTGKGPRPSRVRIRAAIEQARAKFSAVERTS
jgi:transcriptional regulator with XRE-family HTH domain